jgi:hypothetical protein
MGTRIRVPSAEASAEDRVAFQQDLQQRVPELVLTPGEGAAPEEVQAFWSRVGVPKDAQGYNVELGDLPPGVTVDETLLDGFRQLAHQNHMTQDAFQGALKFQLEGVSEIAKQAQAAQEASEAKLKEAWGDILQSDTSEQSNLVRMAFAEIGKTLLESDQLSPGDAPRTGMTPAEAERRLAEMMANRDHAIHKGAQNPAWKDAVYEQHRLTAFKMGQQPQKRGEFFERMGWGRGPGQSMSIQPSSVEVGG